MKRQKVSKQCSAYLMNTVLFSFHSVIHKPSFSWPWQNAVVIHDRVDLWQEHLNYASNIESKLYNNLEIRIFLVFYGENAESRNLECDFFSLENTLFAKYFWKCFFCNTQGINNSFKFKNSKLKVSLNSKGESF